jgi:cytochrome c-type biogenesis protein CcmH
MTFWIVAALILLAVTAALLWPLLRRRPAPRDAADFDMEVYRDQLRQVERDHAEGLIDDRAAEAARAEVGRRLLAADARRAAAAERPAGRPDRTVALAIGVLVPVCALLLYADLGTPDMPGFPFQERSAQGGDRAPELKVLEAQLRKHLEREPTDLRAWGMLARTYMQLDQYDKAVRVYEKTLVLDGGNAELMAGLAEAQVLAAKGIVTPEARKGFEAVLKKAPHSPRALFYLASADEQAGKLQAALDRWKTLLESAPPGAAWLKAAHDRAARTAAALGLDPATALPAPAKGPTAGDVAAAQAMSPEDRQAMIESMVAQLAARLAEKPDDLNGWLRLGRSYSVLKKDAEARDALAKAAALAPGDKDVLLLYGRAIRTAAGNKQTPESLAVMRQVLGVDPKNVEALWLVGTAEAEAGDRAAGTEKMRQALDQIPANAPNRDALAKRLEELKAGK